MNVVVRTFLSLTSVLFFLSTHGHQVWGAEKLFNVKIDDGTSPVKSIALVDTLTQEKRVIEVDRTGHVIWSAALPKLSTKKKICSGADIEYHKEKDLFRILLPYYGILEINRGGTITTIHRDEGISHDFDTLENGNIVYTRGWAKKGEAEIIEIEADGNIVWRWVGAENISQNFWLENAQIEKWPIFWRQRLDRSRNGLDWLHVNGVTQLSKQHYMLSVLNLNSILVVNRNGDMVAHYPDTYFVHEPTPVDGGIVFAEKKPVSGTEHLTRRITFQKEDSKRLHLFEDRFGSVRGITKLADGWFQIVSGKQIAEINLSGEIRFLMEIDFSEDKDNRSGRKLKCDNPVGALYKVAALHY